MIGIQWLLGLCYQHEIDSEFQFLQVHSRRGRDEGTEHVRPVLNWNISRDTDCSNLLSERWRSWTWLFVPTRLGNTGGGDAAGVRSRLSLFFKWGNDPKTV